MRGGRRGAERRGAACLAYAILRIRIRSTSKYTQTHYHPQQACIKLASKTRFSFICAQFYMIHDFLCDVKSRALRRSVSNLLRSFITM